MNRLQGKYVLITGASQGLGQQLALAYAREGADGVAIAARRVELLNAVRDQIAEIAPKTQVLVIAADLTQKTLNELWRPL